MYLGGDFRAPANHVTFHYHLAPQLHHLMINEWDAYKAYRELFFRPVAVADSVRASDVAQRILYLDNSLLSENTVRIITSLLVDYCGHRSTLILSLEELANQNDEDSIEVCGSWSRI
jgi:hypothetical protein